MAAAWGVGLGFLTSWMPSAVTEFVPPSSSLNFAKIVAVVPQDPDPRHAARSILRVMRADVDAVCWLANRADVAKVGSMNAVLEGTDAQIIVGIRPRSLKNFYVRQDISRDFLLVRNTMLGKEFVQRNIDKNPWENLSDEYYRYAVAGFKLKE